MASYKDIIPKFNPYVQQRPVEAMMKVGVYKQQRYDEGVQKIQESIDNIAGLDVVRPEDKQYLESKLNQLGSQLSMVAGGDFSNFQLVNSVNGMTNQIAKDPTIVNAVANTAKYRKDLETVAKLRQEGKWADSNQYAFNKDADAWFNGGLDASYSANTSPYVDVSKEARDIVKAMAKDYTNEDVVFDYDESGQIVGVRDALTRTKIEGITPDKIQTALKTGLTPQAWRQLSIDGQYKYSNVSSSAFVNDINQSYQSRFAQIAAKREELANAIPGVSVSEQTRLGNLIKDLDANARDLKSEYNSISSGFGSGDVESAKAQYYTMNWLENTSNAMSSKGQSISYHTNPYKTQQNFNRRMKQDAYFAQKRIELAENRLLFDINKYNVERDEKKKKEQEEQKKKQGQTLLIGDDKFGTSTSQLLQKQQDDLALANDAVATRISSLKSIGLDDATIKLYMNNPQAVKDPVKRKLILDLKASDDKRKALETRKAQLETIANEIANVYDEKYIPTSMIYGKDSTGAPLYHSLGSGGAEDLGIADIAALLDMFDKSYKITRYYPTMGPSYTAGGITDVSFDNERAEEELRNAKDANGRRVFSDDEIQLYRVYSGQITPEQSGLFSTISMGDLTTNDYDIFMDAVNQYRTNTKDVKEKRDEFIAKQLEKEQMLFAPSTFSIDKKDFTNLKNDLSSLAVLASQTNDVLDSGVEREDLESLVDGTINSATYYTNGKDTQGLIVNGQQIPLTKDIYDNLTVTSNFSEPTQGMAFYMDEIAPSLVMTPPKLVQDRNGNTVPVDRGYYTTAADGEYNVTKENAAYNSSNFPNIDFYDIAANVVTTEQPEKAATVTMNMMVTDPIFGEPRRVYIESAVEKIQEAFNINIQQLYQILYQQEIANKEVPPTPSAEYMQALEAAAQKVKID